MKVLLSAYACEPGKGSEPEVGLRAMLAAASRHDVWVLTRENNIGPLESFLGDDPRRERITLIGVEADGLARKLKKGLGTVGIQWYYRAWQDHAAREAERLDREIAFDVVHHATFASFWAPIGVASLDRPLVIGPVGGGVSPPLSLASELGVMGALTDGARLTYRWLASMRPRVRADLRRARVVLVQNQETLDRLGPIPTARLLSNATSVDVGQLGPPPAHRNREIATTGRLIPFKGGITAVRALRHIEDSDVRLVMIGEGPDRGRIMRMASKLGVADRVEVLGWQPREDTLRRVRQAGVLLHTALHEEASLSVAEALSVGTPVVTYDHGGPAEVLRRWPAGAWRTVEASTPGVSAQRLAAACEEFLRSPPPIPAEPILPSPSFTATLLDAYEEATTSD
jgi:glycosyltransferase involved in cell wall biosynthesis